MSEEGIGGTMDQVMGHIGLTAKDSRGLKTNTMELYRKHTHLLAG